jgi:hypothetical protein
MRAIGFLYAPNGTRLAWVQYISAALCQRELAQPLISPRVPFINGGHLACQSRLVKGLGRLHMRDFSLSGEHMHGEMCNIDHEIHTLLMRRARLVEAAHSDPSGSPAPLRALDTAPSA